MIRSPCPLEVPSPEDRLKNRKALADSKTWKSKDGREIAYADLDKYHLINILLFLRRATQISVEFAAEHEGVWVDQEEAWQKNKPLEWDGLVEEARTRGGLLSVVADRIEEGMNEVLIRCLCFTEASK